MAPRSGLRLGQTQRLALTPAMRQSLHLLALPADLLREEIAREAADNPFLLLHERPRPASGHDALNELPAPPAGLVETLFRQIRAQRLDPETERAALFLAGELREDGFLDVTLDELAAETGVPVARLEQGLAAVQRCEPSGVGARDLAECLTLQLADAGFAPDLAARAIRHLEEFADWRTARLAARLSLSEAEVARLAAAVRTLRPVPVESDQAVPATRIPDILVERLPSGGFSVTPNPVALPTVSVMALPRDARNSEEIRAVAARAARFASAVMQRTATLCRVGAQIVESQPAFFGGNPARLEPASRAAAAAALGLHPSTLGRAVRGKSLSFGGKVYPLATFFSRALPAAAGAVSAHDVQQRIRALVGAEDAAEPLADDTIATQLKAEGVDIARRTVAKYRKWMRIPPSYQRRRPTRPEHGR